MEGEALTPLGKQDAPTLWRGALAGLLAGLAMSLAMLAARQALGVPSVPEMVADGSTALVPPAVFSFLLDALLTRAKPLLFLGLFALQLLAGVGIGVGYAAVLRAWPRLQARPWLTGAPVLVVLVLFNALVLAPVTDGGLLGSRLDGGAARFMAATILYYLAYVVVLSYAAPGRKPLSDSGAVASVEGRRLFLRRALLWTGGLAVAGYGAKLVLDIIGAATPSKSFSYRGQMPPEVTPNDRFYTVSKNIVDPTVDPAAWALEVTGLVESPYTLTLPELQALPSRTQYVTLECISNPVGGDLMSNALWRGVPLRELLNTAKLKPGVVDVACFSDDGYSDSIPLSLALDPDVLVAYEMNGVPLPREHGAPARLIVPGRYGVKHVKWLIRIAPVDKPYLGYWQERGWGREAEVKTTSRIDVPADGAALPLEEGLVGGVAFAGARGIQRVEISTDRGKTWREAFLKSALSPYTWVLWTTPWGPPRTGGYTILVRATDGTSEVQTAVVEDSLPDGASGWHKVTVSVEGAQPTTR